MKFEKNDSARRAASYPTKWKRKFALFPRRVGKMGEAVIYAWLEYYEERMLSDDSVPGAAIRYVYERRTIGKTDIEPIQLVWEPDPFM
jgi:hypothetical protein